MDQNNREFQKISNGLLKGLNEGFRAVNENLTDVARSLRKLSNKNENDDYWHPVFGVDGVIREYFINMY